MYKFAQDLEFEKAAAIRDQLHQLREQFVLITKKKRQQAGVLSIYFHLKNTSDFYTNNYLIKHEPMPLFHCIRHLFWR